MSPAPEPDAPPAWHALDVDAVLGRLGVDPEHGLAAAEAAARLARHGPNRLPSLPPPPPWLRFLRQFHNLLIHVMLAAAGVTALLGHWVDSGVLLGAVLVNAVIGYVQEGRATQALEAIRHMLSLQAAVRRDGERGLLPAEALVPGDIVLLASGDKVPADLRLVSARGLCADEAVLTGESQPVEKSPEPVPAAAPPGERSSLLHSGTLVASGVAVGVVVATGRDTELGHIGTLLARVQAASTPLLRQLDGFSRWLAGIIVVLAGLAFALGVGWRGESAEEMFLMAVALAASAIPEGLPAILTITLALGVRRMAQREAIVRHLPAVEALGAVTVICSDKTGTLTCNEMTVQRVVTAVQTYEVEGSGYAPEGALRAGAQAVAPGAQPLLAEIGRAALLCNDAVLRHGDAGWCLDGDPTEGALLTLAMKVGLDPAAERHALPRLDSLPFESQHCFMATLHATPAGDGRLVFIKGAPERVLDMCSRQRGPDGADEALDPDHWRRAATDCAARALRVLALAVKRLPASQASIGFADVESGCTLLGLLGSLDPPRAEATAAVAECTAAGIRVKMITGDHAETARAIGARLGVGLGRPALTGAEIEVMDDAHLRRVAPQIDVFARTSPEHKLRLVQALQGAGEVVAMTGDGVNDAPALKCADIGVAMGRKGTEAAKEAADMVLADDNFATLGRAVREGRGLHDNIEKFILFMLPTNGGEALVVLAALLLGLLLPLTPAQVLWINMVTSGTLGVALAFEPPEDDVMRRRPRDPQASLLSRFFAWRVLMVSLLMASAALGLFLWELRQGAPLATARTVAVSAVVAAEMFYLLASRHIERTTLSREGLFGNRHALAAIGACALLQLAYVHAGALQRVFGSTPLSAAQWGRVILSGALVFAVAELEKAALRAWRARRRGAPAPPSPAEKEPPA